MQIGGKNGRRPFLTPNNAGMTDRVNARIEHTVAAFNLQQNEALKADGVPILVWHRNENGGRMCTCTGASTPVPTRLRHDDPTGVQSGTPEIANPSTGSVEFFGIDGREELDSPIEISLSDDGWGDEEIEGGDAEAAETPTYGENGDDPVSEDAEYLSQFLPGGGSFGSPSKFAAGYTTATSASCPVCAGATYIEAWQPHGARRYVMSFHEQDDFDHTGILDVNARPNILTLDEGQYVEWSLKLPKYFESVLRFGLWHGRRNLREDAQVQIFHEGAFVDASPQLLASLAIGGGGLKRFRFQAQQRTLLTHFDTIILLATLPRAQFPPLNAPAEVEFQDYMTSISIEVGADVRVSPGSLISDFKNRKMWRVTNAVRKATAGGRNLPAQVDLQAVTSFDKQYVLHPFYVPVEQAPRMFTGVNEKLQGSSGDALTDRND